MDEASRVQRLADHARRGRGRPPRGAQPTARGGGLRRHARGVAALLAGEGVGVAELTTSARALPCFEALAAPQHRRRAGLGARQHAGNRRARLEARPASGRCGPGSGCRPRRPPAARPAPAGMSGSRAGANGDSFAAALAMPLLLEFVTVSRYRRAALTAWPRAGARSPSSALDLRIDVLDLSLTPQVRRDLLRLLGGSWPPPPGP